MKQKKKREDSILRSKTARWLAEGAVTGEMYHAAQTVRPVRKSEANKLTAGLCQRLDP
jgi:hypothetical protein